MEKFLLIKCPNIVIYLMSDVLNVCSLHSSFVQNSKVALVC